jgi:hypothetical protein
MTHDPSMVSYTDSKEIHKDQCSFKDNLDKDNAASTSDSSEEDSDIEQCDDDLSEHDFDGDVRFSSKSLISVSSKASSSIKPASSKSVSSHQSTYASSSISEDENDGPTTADDMMRLREQIYQSLEEEKRLLGIQEKLLTQMEEVEHSIVRVEHEERIARVTSQQAHIVNLLNRARNAEDTRGARKP